MINNNSNENSNKINRSNSQKNKFASATHFFVYFFTIVNFCHFAQPKHETSLLKVSFYGGTVLCAHQKFCCWCSCSLLFFSLPLIFTLLNANISHFLPVIMKFSSFSSDEICLLRFFITCSSSFSVIHIHIHIKN